MTMSVQCRRCGHVFETAATTNTRCRQCRTVVNIGRTTDHRGTAADRGAPTEAPKGPDSAEGTSAQVLGVAISAAGAYALWHGFSLRSGGPGADEKSVRKSRRRWCAVGAVAVVAGVWIIVKGG
jgi:DNA-directed RNA polymerase subunit RPC12/RpoP